MSIVLRILLFRQYLRGEILEKYTINIILTTLLIIIIIIMKYISIIITIFSFVFNI